MSDETTPNDSTQADSSDSPADAEGPAGEGDLDLTSGESKASATAIAEAPPAEPKPAVAEAMIVADGLSKFYGDFAAAKGVSFSVPAGQVAAFLGPNGAGKSTTMKMLTGFLAPSEGTARIGGFDICDQRLEAVERIGYLPENGPLYPEMTPNGLLQHVAAVRCMPKSEASARMEYVAEKCALRSVWRKPIGKLSKGFRQRVGMAVALLHDPDVLILDEPTAGLDPNQVHDVRELIRGLGRTKTILLSTHILQEVQAVCERVLMINNGRLVFDDSTATLADDAAGMEQRFREMTRGLGKQ